MINAESAGKLSTAFATIFLIAGLGFVLQRVRWLSEGTVAQLTRLVVHILLPCTLFFTTATQVTLESLDIAPALIVLGIAIPLLSYLLATLALKPAGVASEQRSAFRFSAILANTAFLGIPICAALFGPLGAVYAVLYDFGTSLIALTLGVWELKGGRLGNWRPLLFNPLIWGVLLGLAWALTSWPLPPWLAGPFSALSDATLPLILVVAGAQVGSIRPAAVTWRGPLVGLLAIRLAVVPLIVGLVFAGSGGSSLRVNVATIQSAMPVGLTSAIFAENYGADAQFAASASLWSTLAAMISVPLVAIVLLR